MSDKFYITTAIPYPNGHPHLGFGLEILQADVFARYNRLRSKEVFFLTGTDEHGLKVFESAKKEGLDFQEYVDRNSAEFARLKEILNISYDNFIRTTDKTHHWPGAQKLWQENSKDIYLKEYKGLYCIGCEAFVTEKELIDGLCPEHKLKPELVKEKNYFFRLSKYKGEIKKLIETDELKIVPAGRKKELLNMLKDSQDFSISRPKEKIPWGIPVPGDPSQIQYVWYDGLANYLTGIGYGWDDEKFNNWWPANIHCIGKGILRFHAIYWPAMLLSAGLALPKLIFVHGYITIDGEKISKSLGNVISPKEAVGKYDVDPVRYFLLREIPSGEDGDFSYKKLEERYQADLANGLGNLVQRVLTLIETGLNGELDYLKRFEKKEVVEFIQKTFERYDDHIAEFKLHEALTSVFELVNYANSYTNQHRPWELVKDNPDHFLEVMTNLVLMVLNISFLIYPFTPETAENIFKSFGWSPNKKLEELDHQKLAIKKGEGLFPRL